MKKTERLFRIIDRLRGHKKAVTADQLAAEMNVSVRTIYRDMKTLESQAIPVEGEAGVGYMLGHGFDAPPMAFDRDELDALTIGLRLVGREADPILQGAALSALEKIRNISKVPEELGDTPLYAPDFGRHEHLHMMSIMRMAMRNATVMDLEYEALSGEHTLRSVNPLALIFFPNAHLLAAWCNLRQDFRNFRMDRILSARDSGDNFTQEKPRLLRNYQAYVHREMNRCDDTGKTS
ncbi:MAG TPA: YafY family transcriptional regulator [Hellea balneolensis]|uniref:YafY family transcriptional regulator n=1 Tax=Hellea balneolensis TaxID=287478 RepID=A0A7C3C4I7_9PROT|nr:YafY family transcriptional regulator [Hellea balneolensis]